MNGEEGKDFLEASTVLPALAGKGERLKGALEESTWMYRPTISSSRNVPNVHNILYLGDCYLDDIFFIH